MKHHSTVSLITNSSTTIFTLADASVSRLAFVVLLQNIYKANLVGGYTNIDTSRGHVSKDYCEGKSALDSLATSIYHLMYEDDVRYRERDFRTYYVPYWGSGETASSESVLSTIHGLLFMLRTEWRSDPDSYRELLLQWFFSTFSRDLSDSYKGIVLYCESMKDMIDVRLKDGHSCSKSTELHTDSHVLVELIHNALTFLPFKHSRQYLG